MSITEVTQNSTKPKYEITILSQDQSVFSPHLHRLLYIEVRGCLEKWTQEQTQEL